MRGKPTPTGKTVTPLEFLSKAREYVGTPYRDFGRKKGEACDCIGLPIMTVRELGIGKGDFFKYTPTPYRRHAETIADRYMVPIWTRPGWDGAESARDIWTKPVAPECIPVGCIGLFWYSNRSEPTHFAVVGRHPLSPDTPTLIHAHQHFGKVVEMSLDDFWTRRLVKSYWAQGVDSAMVGAIQGG